MTARKSTLVASNQSASKKPAKPMLEEVDAAHDEAVKESAYASFIAAQRRLFQEMNVPSGTRFIVSVITSLIVGFGIGFVGALMIDMLVMSAISFGAGTFITMAIQIIGMVATLVGSWFAGGAVSEYILSQRVDQHLAIVAGTARNAWNSVTSMFNSTPKVA